MKYLSLVLAVLPIAVQAICPDPPCVPEPPEPKPPKPKCDPATKIACGNTCCDKSLEIRPQYCANAAKSLCCPSGTVEINNQGVCCAPGSIVLSGKCCPAGSKLCGGDCCDGTCNSSGMCVVSDQHCKALGFPSACATTPPGFQCAICVMGCCIPKV